MAVGASPQRQSTSRRLVTYALIVVGLGLTAYAVGERLPGHSHSTAAESADDHEHDTHSGDGTDHDDGMSHDHGGGHEVSLVDAAATSGGYELVEVSRDGIVWTSLVTEWSPKKPHSAVAYLSVAGNLRVRVRAS